MVSITKCLCSGDFISRNVFSISSLKPISVESMSDRVGSAGKIRLAIRMPPEEEINGPVEATIGLKRYMGICPVIPHLMIVQIKAIHYDKDLRVPCSGHLQVVFF